MRDKALSFVYGLRMDISVASYILAPVVLMAIAGVFLNFFGRALIYKIYTCIVLFLVLLITTADLEVYRSWGFRIDTTPLKYLSSPQEVWASISHLPLTLILVLFTLAYTGIALLFIRFIKKNINLLQDETGKLWTVGVLLLVTGFLIVPMRGGFQLTPMNQSMVYFSKQNFANVTAVNATWNFLNGLDKGAPVVNPYKYTSPANAKILVDSLYRSSDSTTSLINVEDPNVIIIIWESLTSKALDQNLEGIPILPRLNELRKEGVFFSQIYASGDRTDKGVAAVLSGYPAMNNVSVIRFPKKSSRLQTLPGFFKDRGYNTSFYYGGETEFANIKSYLLQSHYDRIIDKNDFQSRYWNSKWGAHDGVVGLRISEDLKQQKQPFFTTWLTLSSHEPFETPEPSVFNGKDHASQFANSLHYTDAMVYDFIRLCKHQPWWEKTIVVIIADHGHILLQPSDPVENFKIPMLWLGGALNASGIEVNTAASQTDLAHTLASQFNSSSKLFPFSKNILDPATLPWAFYSFNNGFGFMQDKKGFVFDNVGKQVIIEKGKTTTTDLDAGQALQQMIFQDFIEK